jgi:uncharacterized membrane protein
MEGLWEQGGVLLVHLTMGIGLAACAGLRAFLPLFVVGLAGHFGWVPLSESFDWLAAWPALVVFGAAVLVEVLADKFPVVDHVLDTVQTFVKPIAGALVMATVVEEWAPLYLTVVAIVVGGSTAGAVHLTKAKLRLVSSATTAGLGNPALSASEDGVALAGVVGSIAVPPLVVVVLAVIVVLAWVAIRRLRPRPA